MQEILCQLLKNYPKLVPLVFHIYLNLLLKWLLGLENPQALDIGGGDFCPQWNNTETKRVRQLLKAAQKGKTGQIKSQLLWQPGDVEDALRIILHQSEVSFSCLLFIDALDEHSGDHSKLLEALMRFTEKDRKGVGRIKLCLASRLEQLFLINLGKFPGFAIHDHTKSDIETYTFGRLETVFTLEGQLYDSSMLKQLAEKVTEKANGVFIWVRLVVEDLIEAVIDGNTVAQLELVLSSLPDDLADLYRRIIQRRKPAYLKEAYVMFRIVLQSGVQPLYLVDLMAATDVALTGYWAGASEESMRRRLLSRCGGLLEVVRSAPSSGDGRVYVQLVHQTLKEYLHVPENATLGLSLPGQDPETDGLKYLLGFGVYIATQLKSTDIDKFLTHLRNSLDYARQLEHAGVDVTSEIDGFLKISVVEPDGYQMDGLYVLRTWPRLEIPWAPVVPDLDERRDYDLAVAAALHGCLSYIRHKAVLGLPVTLPGRFPLILGVLQGVDFIYESRMINAGLQALSFQEARTCKAKRRKARVQEFVELLDLLMVQGADVNCEWESSTSLSCLLNSHRRTTVGTVFYDTLLPILQWLLDHDADPNRRFLMCLIDQGLEGALKLLLQYGLNPMMANYNGLSLLYYAVKHGRQENAELLCQYGADPTQLGRGIQAWDPGKPEFDWIVPDGMIKHALRLRFRDMLLHYSDPKNRKLARQPGESSVVPGAGKSGTSSTGVYRHEWDLDEFWMWD